jgi:hypothetical protein
MHERITITGISLRGKNRFKEASMMLGTREWRVLERQDRVPFNQSVGPWFLVEPRLENPKRKGLLRWVHGVLYGTKNILIYELMNAGH